MHPLFFIIFSLLLVCVESTATTGKQLAAAGGRGDDNKCFHEERLALLQFKSHLLQDPDDYGCISTWIAEEEDCCSWSGVTCHDQTGHVIELDFYLCRLVGKISHSLLNLTYLSRLDLSENSFHGTIPKFIGSMTQLKFLDLSYNSFSGTVPPEFGNLTNLQALKLADVGRCRVENIEWLSRLSHLEDLRMDGISLAKQNHWVDLVLSLRNLSTLSLEGCELSEVMHPYSSSFLNSSSSSIQTLDLRNNNLNSSMYRWLFPLTSNKLRALDLSSNMLDGIPTYLGNLCSLGELEFDNNCAVVEFPVFLNNLSGCTSLALDKLVVSNNSLTGSLPDEIQKFPALSHLDLSQNQLNGTISEKLLELTNLYIVDLSKNSLQGVPFSNHMSNLSYIVYIDLSSCKLGPHFPKWIHTQKNLASLNLANTGISDTLPLEFWDTWTSELTHLDLSSNNISGKVPNISSPLAILDLSKNNFSGGISFLCQLVDGILVFLDLSQNFLSGPIPDCLWHFRLLTVLNLGNNNLFGRLPAPVMFLTKLEVLDLYNNDFSGELPFSLQDCTSLNVLNLGANKFSGNVPFWIGENLSGLYVLILTSNNFSGTIPLQICQLANLQILDLSMNNLHGIIPSCVNNLTAMVQEGPSKYQNQHEYMSLGFSGVYLDHAMIGWQGVEREFFNNLKLLKMIDLSSNNLTGQIPHEITNLHGLIALNLSKNALHGEIPQKIGQMKNLLALDLSRNFLSGEIPSSMSQKTLLSYLDVSSNNLSGRIPSSTQLQSFDSSRYDGNVGLCGLPLPQKCSGPEVPSGDGEDKDEDFGLFYIGIGTGFATGFWIILMREKAFHVLEH